ncbi:MAG: FliH/SctL family protein [Gemmatimonadota bacterium]
MSKVIRTGRVSGSVVTLGRAEGDLYLREGATVEAPLFDLEVVFGGRLESVVASLTQEWEGRLRQERDAARTAAERQQREAEERHRAEVEKVSQERYDEGFRDGVTAKEDEARAAVARLDALHQALKQERHQTLMEAEGLVVDLAVAIARRVTGIQAEVDRRVLVKVIRSALEHLAEKDNLVIKVSPADLQVARRFAQQWVARVDADAVMRVVASDYVERGGCMIESREENVDARLGEQINVMETALREAVARPGQDGPADGQDPPVDGGGGQA